MGEGTIRRAFELAKSGAFSSVTEIRRQLELEKLVNVSAHLSGALIKKQLNALMKGAKAEPDGPAG